MKKGLVSVTFRQLPVDEIIKLTAQAKLNGIEWGGDIHCPPVNLKLASEVGAKTRESGLEAASYGSYYNVGIDDNFREILDTAIALKAPTIRCWAGNTGSIDATDEYWNRVVSDAQIIADMSADAGISVSFEYHGDSLTDIQSSTVRLLNEINRDNIFTYWQPLANTNYTENLSNIKELSGMKKLKNIHVFYWEDNNPFKRMPLSAGASYWRDYIASADAEYALMEFVLNDSPEQFLKDAEVLRAIVG